MNNKNYKLNNNFILILIEPHKASLKLLLKKESNLKVSLKPQLQPKKENFKVNNLHNKHLNLKVNLNQM